MTIRESLEFDGKVVLLNQKTSAFGILGSFRGFVVGSEPVGPIVLTSEYSCLDYTTLASKAGGLKKKKFIQQMLKRGMNIQKPRSFVNNFATNGVGPG
jgi:hypothetical protein